MLYAEKLVLLKEFLSRPHRHVDYYIGLLEKMGDIKKNYRDYLTNDDKPFTCDDVLHRLYNLDYRESSALLTMLTREDHFCETFYERYDAGEYDAVINHMIEFIESIEPILCPICGQYEFDEEGDYDICEICFWENDPLQNEDHDYAGGANVLSVNEYKEKYEKGLR